MTVRDLFETLDYTSYDEIVVHWPNENTDFDNHEVRSDFAESIVDLFGDIHIPTTAECYAENGDDAALFIHCDKDGKIRIHIYININKEKENEE